MATRPASKESARPLRLLVVDDSEFFRRQLVRIVGADPALLVVGEAANGRDAVELAEALRPDLITMDVEMPVMDGIDAVREIMRRAPTRIVMLSSFTRDGAEATLTALEAGAVDFITKRSLGGDLADASAVALCDRLRSLGDGTQSTTAMKTVPGAKPGSVDRTGAESPIPVASGLENTGLLLLGASTGGPALLGELVEAIPAGFMLPMLIAVHMPQAFTGSFAERLAHRCRVPVREARDGMRVTPGEILLAPGGLQTTLVRRTRWLELRVQPGAAEALYKPSIDQLLASAATEAGRGTLAIILTGMGCDGVVGAAALVKAGGTVWAQDAESSAVFGMPSAVIRAGLATQVLSANALAACLRRSA